MTKIRLPINPGRVAEPPPRTFQAKLRLATDIGKLGLIGLGLAVGIRYINTAIYTRAYIEGRAVGIAIGESSAITAEKAMTIARDRYTNGCYLTGSDEDAERILPLASFIQALGDTHDIPGAINGWGDQRSLVICDANGQSAIVDLGTGHVSRFLATGDHTVIEARLESALPSNVVSPELTLPFQLLPTVLQPSDAVSPLS